MAAGATIYVENARAVIGAFRLIDAALAKDFGERLKQAAEPVATTSKEKVTRFAGASVNTIRTRRSGATVYVEQSARKVDGKHGDFGRTQMRLVLEPALDERSEDVIDAVNAVLDGYSIMAGF